MRAYLCFFKIRFINGLQYRTAAYAGIATQFAWGFMYIMMYQAFYKSNPSKAPMNFSQLASYLWLQQAFLALFMTWFLDEDIFTLITSGNIAYELSRPFDIYNTWFVKSCAVRLSRTLLRCFPILIVAFFLPAPYKFSLPNSFSSFLLFIITMFLSFMVVVSYCMLVYIFTFYTVSPMGVRLALVMTADFLSGSLVPLPFLPNYLTKYIYLSPFAAMQNIPLRVYSGQIPVTDAFSTIALQVFWLLILILIGKFIISKALKRVTVQGG
ncbi:ABC transporter permease [Clostridium hydrogenum]|uniref:ABC transporter permease n=1 Tax=Clostridium hydrogenum TaxID=2855764 RepID=UPI001F409373|nr:ABC transporter permease [Clostridium hydrogenum]